MDQDFSDYSELNFNGEKDFGAEIEDILNNTVDVTKDWKVREGAIRRIAGVIIGNYGQETNFIKLLNTKLTANLIIQMNDLRSTIMKEACRVVCFICQNYRSSFELGALTIMSQGGVIKLISSANKVITDTGSQCQSEIVKYVESPKIIAKLADQIKSKNSCARLRAAQNILHIFSEYDKPTILDKNIQTLEEILITATKDASTEVRNCSKKIYLKFSELYPSRANNMLNFLDHGIQKAIIEEMKKSESSLSFNSKAYSDKTQKTNSMLSSSMKEKSTGDDKISVNLFKMSGGVMSASKNENKISETPLNKKDYIPKQINTPDKKKLPKFFSPQKPIIKEGLSGLSLGKTNSHNNNESATTLGTVDMRSSKISEKGSPKPKKSSSSTAEEFLKNLLYDLNESNISEVFARISNNFNEIINQIDSISNTTLRMLVNSLVDNLSNENKTFSITVMNLLHKFIDQLPELFSIDDIEKIVLGLIINISNQNMEVSRKASSLLILMKKKFSTGLLIQPIIEFINNESSESNILVCVEVLNILLDGTNESTAKEFFINNFVEKLTKVIFSRETINEVLIKVTMNLFESLFSKSPSSFIISFISINDQNDKDILLSMFEIHKKNIAFAIKNANSSNSNNKSVNKIHKEKKEVEYIQSHQKAKPAIKLFPENYENELLKPVNKEFLSRVNTFDSQSFLNYVSGDPKNILAFLISLFKIKEEEVTSALEHIVFILTQKPSLFLDNLDLLVNRLTIIYDNFPQYYELINQSFNLVALNMDGKIYLKLIQRYILKSNPAIIQIILTSLNSCFTKLEKTTLLDLLPNFIEALFSLMNHSKTEIRKMTVFCIVDLYFAIGEEFESFINQLNTSQRNLINIYINKRMKK